MTPAQLLIFKTAILADTNLVAQRAAGNQGAIAAYYNGTGAGSIWRPSISVSELNTAIVWSEFAGLTSQLQATYQAMITNGFIDATNANIRGGFSTVFSGKVSLTNLTALAQRTPTIFENLFTTNSICAVHGQQITPADIAAALGS